MHGTGQQACEWSNGHIFSILLVSKKSNNYILVLQGNGW